MSELGTLDGGDPATEAYRNRADVYATERGDGPAVVCAHGTLMDRTMFAPQLEALSDDYRVLAYDLRARTDQYATAYDLYDLADDAAALMEARGIDSCVLVGMSMGGFTALRFAERYPERLDGMVLVDSDALTHDEADRERYGAMVEGTREAGRPSADLVEVVKHVLFGETTNAENRELVDAWGERWRSYPGEAVYNEVHSWLDRPDFTDACADIDVPTLAVHGEEDTSIDIEHAERTVEALPDARLEPIPEAGHSSNLENPEAANAAIRTFLERVT
jgi:pimeloyl-ACP methyl ester carboxylesterase